MGTLGLPGQPRGIPDPKLSLWKEESLSQLVNSPRRIPSVLIPSYGTGLLEFVGYGIPQSIPVRIPPNHPNVPLEFQLILPGAASPACSWFNSPGQYRF